MRFARFDRWGSQICTLADVSAATWTEELNGEDTLEIECGAPVAKGDRIVWRDALGAWHEHTAAAVEQEHGDAPAWRVTCENSVSELYGDWISDKRPTNATASAALSAVLSPTRWAVGTVDVTGTASAVFYRTSCREALQKLVGTWGGEMWTTVEVSGASVVGRKVNLSTRGEDRGLRFEWRHGLTGIRRTYSDDDVVTALHGFGKGVESGDGYGRGLDFASINGGKTYVEDADALKAWGRPDGRGGRAHVFGKVEFSDCEDARELMELTRAELERRSEPKVSYEASVDAYAAAGYDVSGVDVGDWVALVDAEMEPEVRVKGRVLKVKRDLLDGSRAVEVTLGNVIYDAADMLAAQLGDIHSLAGRATAWDVAAYTPGAYIQQVMRGLNAQFDAGASYIYQSPEQGLIVGSVPLDPETGKPRRTPASAIQLKGGGFRIANRLKSDGSFDWRSFGTGDGFVADEIVAGTIKGGSNTWNLSTGDLKFKQGSIEISGPSNTKVVIDATSGFRVYQNGAFIGGVEVVGGEAHLRAARAGASSSLYMTTGQTNAGNPGASFVNSYGNYLDVEALKAVDDPSGKTTGVGMACFNKPFLHVSDYYDHVWLHPPVYSQDYLKIPPQQMFVGDTNAKLCLSDDRGVFFGDGYAILKFDSTHYVRITSDGVQCRCGSKGFGWINGAFSESLVWS